MEQLATPGSIRLTAETLRLAEGLIQVTPLGPVPVRGLPEPIDVYELVGVTTLRRCWQAAAARGLTRFVGRQTESEVLQQELVRAVAGHGHIVAIVGEAGVGKSRLVYECAHSHSLKEWLVLESTSASYGKATPYFPVIDLLKRYAHVEERDDLRTVRAKITGQVLTLDEALQEAIPALLWLLEALPDDSPFLKLDPPQRRQRTLDALKRVLLRESQVQPLLLVFEDLYWIDAETQALLDGLVDSLSTARILLLVNYRPEYQHSWGSKTIRNCGSSRCRRPVPTHSCRRCWGTTRAWRRSRGGLRCMMPSLLGLDALVPPRPCSSPARAIGSCCRQIHLPE